MDDTIIALKKEIADLERRQRNRKDKMASVPDDVNVPFRRTDDSDDEMGPGGSIASQTHP